MVVAKQLLVVLLAILIANPVCCCTVGRFFEERTPEAARSSCCLKHSSPPNEEAPERPERDAGCPCAKDQSAVVEAKTIPFITGFVPQAPPVVCAPIDPWLPPSLARPITPACLELPPPPPPWRVYCRYLL